LFPDLESGLGYGPPAVTIPERKKQKRLVARILKNSKPLLDMPDAQSRAA